MISNSRNIFSILLVVSLGIAGLLLLFTGWWLPETSTPLQFTGLSWLALCAATYFVKAKPYLQLAAAWLWSACSIWNWWKTPDERSVVWFLVQSILAMLILIFSHLVVVNFARTSRSSA